ncbi:MAG: hypothetical protein M3430_19480 [Acidobacteriota bacterium]|nr:hypothetical protein [Acidobacteriota bacterium]
MMFAYSSASLAAREQMQEFGGTAYGHLLRDDNYARRSLCGDEFPEVVGHGFAVV